MCMISESARISYILNAPVRLGGVDEAPDFLDLGGAAFARHHERGDLGAPCPRWWLLEVLLVLGRVHHDARAVDDELLRSLVGDLRGAEIWSGSPRDDLAGHRDVDLALGGALVGDELVPGPEAELVNVQRGAVEAGRSAGTCWAVRPLLREGSPRLGLDIYKI
jgi:hypothetical protein